jgi:hypothetical protein
MYDFATCECELAVVITSIGGSTRWSAMPLVCARRCYCAIYTCLIGSKVLLKDVLSRVFELAVQESRDYILLGVGDSP